MERCFLKCMTQKNSHILSVLATFVLIVAMTSLYWLDALFSTSPLVIGLQLVALALMLWARLTFGRRSFHFSAQPTSETLITHGAYQLVRHPIYAAIWLFSWAGVAAHFSLLSGLLAIVVLVCLVVRMICEESCLRRKFVDYPNYAKRTARLIPFIL
jgi:protein-S-isoprenylcysteine O-methyltransferase Ste14